MLGPLCCPGERFVRRESCGRVSMQAAAASDIIFRTLCRECSYWIILSPCIPSLFWSLFLLWRQPIDEADTSEAKSLKKTQ
jgi:hypothetical protein